MSTVNEQKIITPPAAACDNHEPCGNTFEGKVVSLIGSNLVMKNLEGKEFSHTLAKDAKLTCDGAVCEAEALKPGSKVRVTTLQDDKNVATGIESLDKKSEFAQCS